MSKLTIFMFSTIISSFALADFEVPNQFEDGQVTSASQMNENFQALKSEIEILRAQLEQNQASTKVQFQGFSTETVSGDSAGDTFARACHNFVPKSRVCMDHEVFLSTFDNTLSIPLVHGWVYKARTSSISNPNILSGCPFDNQGYYLWQGKMAEWTTSCTNANVFRVACCK
jgi:hypothetical protein